MLAEELISETVPSLKTSDTGTIALNWMEVFRISHLPIVNDKQLLGVISDTDIYDLNAFNDDIGNHSLSLAKPYVFSYQHIYEVIEIVAKLKLTIVPVLNSNNEYIGTILLQDLIQQFANLSALNNPGGIIVMELNENDYTLSQIASIVESNDAKILSLYVSANEKLQKIDLTLKINKTEISDVLSTLDRFGYKVKASFMEDKVLDSLYKRRFESLMRYLNT